MYLSVVGWGAPMPPQMPPRPPMPPQMAAGGQVRMQQAMQPRMPQAQPRLTQVVISKIYMWN